MSAIIIGLTGSMGVGKSEASRAFARLGASILDADVLAHYLLSRDSSVKSAVKNLLGEDVFDSQNQPLRKKIADKVFADKSLLEKYEAILHPAIRTLWQKPIAKDEYDSFVSEQNAANSNLSKPNNFSKSDKTKNVENLTSDETLFLFPAFADTLFNVKEKIAKMPQPPRVIEVPLLYEKNLEKNFDLCLDVFCSKSLRRARLAARGMNPAEIFARDAFQLSPEKKASLADVVLFNESSKSFLEVQAALVLSRFI